jgi:hypothetical protein
MIRFFSSLFSDRHNSSKRRVRAARCRSVRYQVESLEVRELMAVVPAGATPAVVSTNHNTILWYVFEGFQERTSNENLAITYFNDAAKLADQAHDPMGLEDIALGWSTLPAGSDGYPGTVAVNFFSQAIGAAEYWLDPQEGAGSGADYAWGSNQLQSVITAGGPLAANLIAASETGAASTVTWLAENNQAWLSNMTDQIIPPIAAGQWEANVGGVNVTFTLNQYVAYASGPCTWNGVQAEITQTRIVDYHTVTPSESAGVWFASPFTVVNDQTGQTIATGWALQTPQFSNDMFLYLDMPNGQLSPPILATRVSGNGWAP